MHRIVCRRRFLLQYKKQSNEEGFSLAMETPEEEKKYVIDTESAAEMARLVNQSRILTEGMGGFFPGQFDTTNIHDVLDIACGPGGWANDVAQSFPHMRVTGVDI